MPPAIAKRGSESVMIAKHPLFLAGEDIPLRQAAAAAKGHSWMALLLSSIAEKDDLARGRRSAPSPSALVSDKPLLPARYPSTPAALRLSSCRPYCPRSNRSSCGHAAFPCYNQATSPTFRSTMAKPFNYDLNQRRVGVAFIRDSRARDILLTLGADSRLSDACALRFAAEIGHAECVRLLIAAVDSNADALAWPFVSAAGNGHPECVKLLLPCADASAKGAALRKAVGNGQAECVRLLIPATDPTADNSAALLLAAELGRDECVKLLIPASRPKAKNSQALRGAIENGHAECARLLIPVSTPLLQNKPLLTAVLKNGGASILSHMLASEPLLLAGQNLFRLKAVAAANGHFELAHLLSSIAEQKGLAALLPVPKNDERLSPWRL